MNRNTTGRSIAVKNVLNLCTTTRVEWKSIRTNHVKIVANITTTHMAQEDSAPMNVKTHMLVL